MGGGLQWRLVVARGGKWFYQKLPPGRSAKAEGIGVWFSGRHEHSIDPKGRIVLPREFRASLGTQVTVQVSPDNCLNVFPTSEWEKAAERVNQLPVIGNSRARALQRHFFSWSKQEEIDNQGRLSIPAAFRSEAGLEKDVVVLGSGSHVQIWNRTALEARDSETGERIDELGEEFNI